MGTVRSLETPDLELVQVPGRWEDFDNLLMKVQTAIMELQKSPLPSCEEVHARQLAACLEASAHCLSAAVAARQVASRTPWPGSSGPQLETAAVLPQLPSGTEPLLETGAPPPQPTAGTPAIAVG